MKRSVQILGQVLGITFVLATSALAAEQKVPFQAAKLVDLRQAPISPSVLTDSKKEDVAMLLLRAAKRENVSAASGFDALLDRQKARDAALIEMIGPDSPIILAFAKALKEKSGGFLTHNVLPESANTIALQMVQSIFLNRRDDLVSTQELYKDAAWQEAIRARLEKGDVPELNVSLSAAKRVELKNTALYIHTPGDGEGKIEPAVHLILTALAQQIGHAALADITKPSSAMHKMFLTSMAKALPNDPAAKEWLNEWLYLREGRAVSVVKEFRPDGELMQEAVADSETKRRARLPNPPAIAYKP